MIASIKSERQADLPLIEARDLSVRIDGRDILNHVDLSVLPGQIVTLIGPNGAGKTTLVRTLLGLVRYRGGELKIARKLKIGYMPQRLRIDPIVPLTVARFVALNNHVTRAEVQDALRQVGAADVERAPVQVISGGEFQRVLLARALLRKPEVLVLDEPAQGVDMAGQGELYKLIASLRDRYGCAVLMISQDLHLVMEAADLVICLNRHVCCTGLPEAVSRHPEYLKLLGAAQRGGLAVYTHHHDHQHDVHGDVVPLRYESKQRPSGDATSR